LITDEKEYELKVDVMRAGTFIAEIPGELTNTLEPGIYTVVAIASAEGAVPSTYTVTIMLY
jgi:peptide/nickel transport system substrate-binding protein